MYGLLVGRTYGHVVTDESVRGRLGSIGHLRVSSVQLVHCPDGPAGIRGFVGVVLAGHQFSPGGGELRLLEMFHVERRRRSAYVARPCRRWGSSDRSLGGTSDCSRTVPCAYVAERS